MGNGIVTVDECDRAPTGTGRVPQETVGGERQGVALSLWMNVIECLLAQGESFEKQLEVSERWGGVLPP